MRSCALLAPLAALAIVSGCTSVRTTEDLESRASRVELPREERLEALREVASRSDRAVASDLVTIAERLLLDARNANDRELAARSREAALDVVSTLVALGPRSSAVLAIRLGDAAGELCASPEALEALGPHEDATVRDLAADRRRRLGRAPPRR